MVKHLIEANSILLLSSRIIKNCELALYPLMWVNGDIAQTHTLI